MLHDLEGWTIRQVADAVGAPVGTVAARVSRGRQIVRDRLDRRGFRMAWATLAAAVAADRAAAEALAAAVGGAAADTPWPAARSAPPGGTARPPAYAPRLTEVGGALVAAAAPLAAAGRLSGPAVAAPIGVGAAALAAVRVTVGWLASPIPASVALFLLCGTAGAAGARLASVRLDAGAGPGPGPGGSGGTGGRLFDDTFAPRTRQRFEVVEVRPANVSIVPEPGSAAVVTVGCGLLLARRHRRHHRASDTAS